MTVRRHYTPEQGKRALGAAVVYYRELAGLTTAELARRAELTPATLHRIERGQAEPHWNTARRIAAALDVPLEQLTGKAERLEGEAPSTPDRGDVGC